MRYYTQYRFLLLANGTRQPRLTGCVPLRVIGASNKGIRIQPMVDYYPSLHYAFSDVTPKALTREVISRRMSFVIANTLILVIGNRMPDIGRLSNYSKNCDVPLFANFSAYRWTPRTSSRGTNYVCRVLLFQCSSHNRGAKSKIMAVTRDRFTRTKASGDRGSVFRSADASCIRSRTPSLCLPVAITPWWLLPLKKSSLNSRYEDFLLMRR